MDLLKEHPFNFRYYLCTSEQNNIYIMFKKFGYTIEANQDTDFENSYIPANMFLNDSIIDDKTVCKTYEMNMNTIDVFYKDVLEYLKNNIGNNINKIKISNFDYEGTDIVFPTEIFYYATLCSKNIYIDIRNAAFRVNDSQYNEIDYLNWSSGTLLIENSSPVIYINEMYIENGIIDTHNAENANIYINFVCYTKANILKLQVYSTIKTNFIGNTLDSESYKNSKILISNYSIFGMEILNSDKTEPRLTISRYKSCIIELLSVNDEVSYGSTLKLDRLNTATICKIERNINNVSNGIPIIIGKIGTVNLYNVNLVFTKKCSIQDEYNIITFDSTDEELRRKINIFDTSIINNTNNSIYLMKIKNMEISSISIHNSIFNNNIYPILSDDNTKIHKLIIDNSTFSNDKIVFKHILVFSAFKTVFKTPNSINISPTKLSLNECKLYFDTLTVNNTSNVIINISSSDNRYQGNNIIIKNDSVDRSTIFNDNGSYFIVKSLNINNYNATLSNSYLELETCTLYGDVVTHIKNPYITFPSLVKKSTFNFNSTCIAGFLVIDDDASNCTLNINVNDTVKFNNTEKLSIDSTNGAPNVNINTNMPIITQLTGFSSINKVNVSVTSDYDSKQSMKIDIIQTSKNNSDSPYVLNNSEKLIKMSKTNNVYNNFTYQFDKI